MSDSGCLPKGILVQAQTSIDTVTIACRFSMKWRRQVKLILLALVCLLVLLALLTLLTLLNLVALQALHTLLILMHLLTLLNLLTLPTLLTPLTLKVANTRFLQATEDDSPIVLDLRCSSPFPAFLLPPPLPPHLPYIYPHLLSCITCPNSYLSLLNPLPPTLPLALHRPIAELTEQEEALRASLDVNRDLLLTTSTCFWLFCKFLRLNGYPTHVLFLEMLQPYVPLSFDTFNTF
jgi:hypothetical protein